MTDPVLIVGGGISGLATAFYLSRAGLRSVIIEKSPRLGGLIQTDLMQGCELEAGPDSFISTKTAVMELAEDLGGGLPGRIIGSNDAARRVFVVRRGKLTPMPKGMAMMVPGEWKSTLCSPLLGLPTKIGLLRETFARPKSRPGDFSVGELMGRHFGPEMLEYVTEPLLCGVYGGESSSLSARSVLPRFVALEEQYGSLIKGVRKTAAATSPNGSLFRSFQGGMQTLTDALSEAISDYSDVCYDEAISIEKTRDRWNVQLKTKSLSGNHLVLACPAWVGAQLLERSAPDVAEELKAIPYSSSILATLLFEKSAINHPLDGFGFLVPRKEQRTIAAATWVNTKFPSRVADGLVALRAFVVGPNAEKMLATPKEEVLTAVRHDFERFMGIQARPVGSLVHKWPQSMPQYVVGHQARVDRLEAELEAHSGLSLTGNYFDGVGIPDSIRRGKQAAKRIARKNV